MKSQDRDVILSTCLALGTAEGIPLLERMAQREIAQGGVLFLDRAMKPGIVAVLERLGFQFPPETGDLDPILRPVVGPPGWTLRPKESAYWTDLLDPKGHVRGHIFYKGAYYDRRAQFYPLTRYWIETEFASASGHPEITAAKARGETVDLFGSHAHLPYQRFMVCDRENPLPIHQGPWLSWNESVGPGNSSPSPGIRSWLDSRYPDHADPLAYWSP
jgi:hypothetical protein